MPELGVPPQDNSLYSMRSICYPKHLRLGIEKIGSFSDDKGIISDVRFEQTGLDVQFHAAQGPIKYS